jgi:hypothetical protein
LLPALLYVRSPARAREVARWLLDANLGHGDRELDDAAKWISSPYHPQWLVARALRNGIGIHHGKIPRALAHHMVRLFNDGTLSWLIVTSTLIEGVNTAAKNIIIVDNKIAKRNLDFYSQGPDTPLSLLIQLPWSELTAASRERLQPYYQQQIVSLDTIRAASGIDPQVILDVASTLHRDPRGWSARLTWTGRPTYDQLTTVCGFIFQLSGSHFRGGASSGAQLARRIDLIRQHHGQIRPLADAQMQFARSKADEAVEDVLDFIREWALHLFPRLRMVLQTIGEDVFHRYDLPAGDYKHYAGAVEALFRPPMLTTLEEYGLPAPLSARLQRFLPLDLPIDRIDEVIDRLRHLPGIAGLSRFEEDMLRDTIDNL